VYRNVRDADGIRAFTPERHRARTSRQRNGPAPGARFSACVERLHPDSTFIPVQVLAELFNVLVKKGRRSREDATAAVLSWGDVFPLVETTRDVLLGAADLASAHQLGIWDAGVLAGAADARCRLLLSEDLQDGFTWRGVTVASAFHSPRPPLLAALLEGAAAERADRT
jgi:predicted nucleic acid-binding protein